VLRQAVGEDERGEQEPDLPEPKLVGDRPQLERKGGEEDGTDRIARAETSCDEDGEQCSPPSVHAM